MVMKRVFLRTDLFFERICSWLFFVRIEYSAIIR